MADPTTDLHASMREIYERCSAGAGVPDEMIMPGSTLNTLNETTIYEPHAMYRVTSDAITKIED